MIYVVIANDYYYPSFGADDWQCVTDSLTIAVEAAKLLRRDSVCVVRINPDCSHHVVWEGE